MLEVNDIINGCYILRRRVGEDSFSEWWQASAIFVASNFLLRFIKDEYASNDSLIKTFLEGAKNKIPIVSPSILSLIEIDKHKGNCFIASEFGGHTHLRSILQTGRRFSVEHTCRLLIELATGIGMFHLHGETFKVLTPECVAVHSVGDTIDELKLLLPGYEEFFNLVPQAKTADFVDLWGYVSPEFKAGKETNSRSDIYSLGVILYRLLVGKLPYGSRSGIKVRTKSAAPTNVAAALTRRGVPRELILATVRALRKNPDLRHGDIVSFIEDLRHILDSRREAWINAGEIDPIADLATLNLRKAKADSKEIARSLETINYFKYLSQDNKPKLPNPIEIIEVDDTVLELEELEELESGEAEDDDSVTTEEYVNAGYKTARISAKISIPTNRKVKNGQSTGEPTIEPTIEPTVEPGVENSTEVVAPPVLVPVDSENPEPSTQPLTTVTQIPIVKESQVEAPLAVVQEKGPKPHTHTRSALGKPLDPPVRLLWRQAGGSPKDVANAITSTVARAREGSGIVKFIEDPLSSDPDGFVAKAIQSLKADSHVIDLGALRKGTSIGELIKSLEGFIELPALSSSEHVPKPSTVRIASQVAKAIAGSADREKPIILVARNTEGIARSAHRLILELAKVVPGSPVCAFFFFNTRKTPSWHVLADLNNR